MDRVSRHSLINCSFKHHICTAVVDLRKCSYLVALERRRLSPVLSPVKQLTTLIEEFPPGRATIPVPLKRLLTELVLTTHISQLASDTHLLQLD
jgi:hypothetical protein